MKKRLALLILLAFALTGQEDTYKYYVFRPKASATFSSITIQQPDSNGRDTKFLYAFIKCPDAACSYVLSKGGTIAGGSTGRANTLDDRAPTPAAQVIVDGVVSNGQTIIRESLTASEAASGRRLGDSGLRLKFEAGVQKIFSLSVTSDSPTEHSVYLEYGEPYR